MIYCKKCVYPISTVNLQIDEDGICTSCKTFDEFKKIPDEVWVKKKEKLLKILDKYLSKNTSNYDCLIPVSGGKDSTRQALHIKERFRLNPLLVSMNYPPEQISKNDLFCSDGEYF